MEAFNFCCTWVYNTIERGETDEQSTCGDVQRSAHRN